MTITEILEKILGARYGRDVRQAIHDGVYRANQVADENKDLVDRVATRQDAVEQYNTQVMQEMTDKDVISAPEIIGLRTDIDGESHDTASERFSSDFDKISSLPKEKIRYISAVQRPIPLIFVKSSTICSFVQ